MDGWNARDEHNFKVDLLERLRSKAVVQPEFVAVTTVRDWFPTRERSLGGDLVTDLAADSDCPLEYVTADEDHVWLTDADATREFLDDLRENPAWFEA